MDNRCDGEDGYSELSVSFQSIINAHSGQCFGYEVLIHGSDRQGFASTEALLDACHATGSLAELEIAIRRKAVEPARLLPSIGERVLFLNLDHRIVDQWGAVMTAAHVGLRPLVAQIVTEISALPGDAATVGAAVHLLRRHGGMVAIDRLGNTVDGLHLVHACDPDFLKIDRSLIHGIDGSPRRRVVVLHLVGMAHTLGLQVVAVGIETSKEWVVCRELGCDLMQGFFVEPPIEDPRLAKDTLPHLETLSYMARRGRQIDQRWVTQQLELLPAIRVDTPIHKVFDRVARNPDAALTPVVDQIGQPLGILREGDMKNYAYSAFGKDLITNKAFARTLRDFLVRCPIADIATPLDDMLAIYSTVDAAEGILITERMVYRGFLSARSIIRAIHDKTISRARDENPLSKLPGNTLITEYILGCIGGSEDVVLAYIDFDNFKPFNDTYGFRQGDRAILLFADLLRKAANPQTWFLGHIGGDDFFLGLKQASPDQAAQVVGALVGRFSSDAESFYDAEARARGAITAADRDGNIKSFPLLTASAVLCLLPGDSKRTSVDEISAAIAAKKKTAKAAPDKLAWAALPRGAEH